LRDDVFAIAAASNFSKFHLVGHDHGACLGWVSAGSAEGRAKVLSYSSLSIPHPTAFNAALAGPAGDLQQQIASQYFTMFVLNDSAAIHNDFWYNSMVRVMRCAGSPPPPPALLLIVLTVASLPCFSGQR